MYDVDTFEKELGTIKNESIRDFTRVMLSKALPYFWVAPSSSTGKYHPKQSNGEGGLVRHTKAAAYFATAFARSYGLTPKETDYAISAVLLHDLCKYGIPGGKHTTPKHDKESADYVMNMGKSYVAACDSFTSVDLIEICKGIAHHTGPWTKHERKKQFPEEYTKIETVVHISDMASAQKAVAIEYLSEPTVGIG